MSKMTLKVMNPRGEAEAIKKVALSPRLPSLQGRKIGILQNTKPGGDMLLPYVQDALKARFPGIEFRKWTVPHHMLPDEKTQALKEIVAYSDGVIALIGD